MFTFTKKIVAMAVMLFALALGGFSLCQSAKADLEAEKAVLAYAQVYAYGSTPRG